MPHVEPHDTGLIDSRPCRSGNEPIDPESRMRADVERIDREFREIRGKRPAGRARLARERQQQQSGLPWAASGKGAES